jgi:hypothetical protein
MSQLPNIRRLIDVVALCILQRSASFNVTRRGFPITNLTSKVTTIDAIAEVSDTRDDNNTSAREEGGNGNADRSFQFASSVVRSEELLNTTAAGETKDDDDDDCETTDVQKETVVSAASLSGDIAAE